MKVNVVYNRMPHHGAYTGYDQVARYLATRIPVERLEPYVPAFIPRGAWEWIASRSGMEWYDRASLGLEAATAIRLLLGKEEICHLLYGEDNYRYLGLLPRFARRSRCKLACTYHQPPRILEKVAPHQKILKNLDALIAVAGNQADYFRSLVDANKVFVVPHGIDTDHFRPLDSKESSGRRCLFVGQWLRDFDLLREVVRLLGSTDASLTFLIITTEENVDRFHGLVNAVVVSRITDAELLAAYQSADLLVLPLIDCTANNSVLEGMACGLPIVTTDVGGIRDYVTPTCAALVPAGDVDGMCDVVLKLTSDHPLRMEMGRESRLRSLRFDWLRVADQLLEVLTAL